MSTIKERSSKFEILRIIAMLMIIAHHFVDHGKIMPTESILSFNNIWAGFLYMWGKDGVNIFVLLSGYFLVEQDNFNIKKLIRLWIKIFLVSIFGFLFAYFVWGVVPDNIEPYLYTFFPITFKGWWFMTTYILLFIVSPFINRLIKNLDIKEYHKLIIILTIFLIIFYFIRSELILWSGIGDNFLWFCYLYILSAYVKLHGDNISKYKIRWGFLAVFVILIKIGLWVYLYIKNLNFDLVRYTAMNRPFTLLVAITLFMTFKESNIKYNKMINTIAGATFGIYLIHDNQMIRTYMWGNIIKVSELFKSKYFIGYSLLSILAVFVICGIIVLIVQNTIEKLIDKK